MNPKQLRYLGILLGIAAVVIIGLRFMRLYTQGNPNWYYLVMVCGMLLLLFYTFRKKR